MAGLNVREVGHARATRNYALADDNWELRFPHSAKVFAKMGREDAQVTSVPVSYTHLTLPTTPYV